MMHYTFRSVNEALPSFADMLLNRGADVPSRVGATKELTFVNFTLTDPLQREIVVEGRKANIAAQIAETMWVLSGRNDVEWLSAYLPRAADFSDDGTTWRAGYGPRLRHWEAPTVGRKNGHVDQLVAVINMLREDPGTRRAVMSIFDPAVDVRTASKDIPCNNWLHFLARDGVLNLHVAIRSNDLVWGWSGINQFEWSTLLEVVAAHSGLKAGSIHYAVSSLHMYDRHWAKAADWNVRTVHTQRDRRYEPGDLDWDTLCKRWFQLEKEIRHLHASGANISKPISMFPEPMLRGWLWTLAWWWTGDESFLVQVWDTRLRHAAMVGTGPKAQPAASEGDAQHVHGDWDAGGYCNRLVMRDGAGDVCGYSAADASDEAARAVEMQRFTEKAAPLHPGVVAALSRPAAKRQHPSNAGRFIEEVTRLHTEKDAAYGTSWKKRGELFSILPNIARKVDRLGNGDTTDENQTDTAVDLMVYLAKYRIYLGDVLWEGPGTASDTPTTANLLIGTVVSDVVLQEQPWTTTELEDEQRQGLDEMMAAAEAKDPQRHRTVEHLLMRATILAMRRWRETPALFARPVDADHDQYLGADHE